MKVSRSISHRTVFAAVICFLLLFAGFSCQKTDVERDINPETKTFVILGSSTAFGTGASSPDSSWVGLVSAKFAKDKKSFKVVNLAAAGFGTYQILPVNTPNTSGKPNIDVEKNITKALSFKPDMIIINLPTNDIAAGYSTSEILDNYKKIVA